MKKNDLLSLFRSISKLSTYKSLTKNQELIKRFDNLIEKRIDILKKKIGFYPCTEDDVRNYTKKIGTQKRIATSLIKYGEINPSKNKTIREKQKQSVFIKYGSNYFTQTEIYKNQQYIKNTTARYNHFLDIGEVKPLFDLQFYIDNAKNFDFEFEWKCCKCGNVFKSKFTRSEYTPARCLKCHPKNYVVSKGEKEVNDFIKSLGIETKENDKSIISPFEIDIVCPRNHICFEYDGLYYHSTAMRKDPRYHFNKTEKCICKGYQLIHIFESDWQLKQEICKSNIRKMFNKIDNIIYMNECCIKYVDIDTYWKFIKENYIENDIYSVDEILGIYKGDELISVLSLKKHPLYDDWWFVIRHCDKINTIVHASFAFLFSNFIELHPTVFNVNYSIDRRWYKLDNLFYKLGFEFSGRASPKYYYYINPSIDSPLKWTKEIQKTKLPKFDDNLTEIDNMWLNGYPIIYNSGYLVYEWKNKGVL